MSLSPEMEAYFDFLDEVPTRRSGGYIIGISKREKATEGHSAVEFRSRTPRLDKRRNLSALLAALIEKDDRRGS